MDKSGMAHLWILLLSALAIGHQASGKELKVTTILEKPYLSEKDGGYVGFIADLMDQVAKKANPPLKYKLVPVQDGKYGQKTGQTWDGMIGELVSRRADMAAAPMTVSDERKTAVEFTNNFLTVGTTVLLKKPADGAEPPITTAADLADQDDIKYGLVGGGVTESFFKNSRDPSFSKMWRAIDSNPEGRMNGVEAGVNKVKNSNGKYAFIMEDITADYWIQESGCELIKVNGIDNSNGYAIAVRKTDPDNLVDNLNKAIEDLRESGEIQSLRQKWWKTDEQCSGATSWNRLPYHVIMLGLAAILTKAFWW